jgi:hypothetical protein
MRGRPAYHPRLDPTPAQPIRGVDASRGYDTLYNATIELDCDHDRLGDKTQDPDPRERR